MIRNERICSGTVRNPDNIAEAGRLRLPYGTCGSLRQSTAAVHSVAARRRLCQIKNAHATAWWREADAGWLLACRCRSGAGNTGSAGLNATGGVTTGCQRRSASGCRRRPRPRWPSTAESTRSLLTSQLELQTRFVWMEKSDVQRVVWIFPSSLVIYHIYCHPVVETQALCVLPNRRE